MILSCRDFYRVGVWNIKDCDAASHDDEELPYRMMELASPLEDVKGYVCSAFMTRHYESGKTWPSKEDWERAAAAKRKELMAYD